MSCKPICYKIAQSYQGLAGSPPQTVSYQKKKKSNRSNTKFRKSVNTLFGFYKYVLHSWVGKPLQNVPPVRG